MKFVARKVKIDMISCRFLSSEAKYICLPDTLDTGCINCSHRVPSVVVLD